MRRTVGLLALLILSGACTRYLSEEEYERRLKEAEPRLAQEEQWRKGVERLLAQSECPAFLQPTLQQIYAACHDPRAAQKGPYCDPEAIEVETRKYEDFFGTAFILDLAALPHVTSYIGEGQTQTDSVRRTELSLLLERLLLPTTRFVVATSPGPSEAEARRRIGLARGWLLERVPPEHVSDRAWIYPFFARTQLKELKRQDRPLRNSIEEPLSIQQGTWIFRMSCIRSMPPPPRPVAQTK